jgi:hypothetical protein
MLMLRTFYLFYVLVLCVKYDLILISSSLFAFKFVDMESMSPAWIEANKKYRKYYNMDPPELTGKLVMNELIVLLV